MKCVQVEAFEDTDSMNEFLAKIPPDDVKQILADPKFWTVVYMGEPNTSSDEQKEDYQNV